SCRWCWRSPDCPPSSCGDGNAALRFALGQPVCSRHLGFGGGLLLGHLLGTPPPERGRSTAQRSGGGRDPHPLPPLFKGRQEIAARSQPDTVAFHMIAPPAAEQPRVLRLTALARAVGAERRGPHLLEPRARPARR